jgi:hypothetical protein
MSAAVVELVRAGALELSLELWVSAMDARSSRKEKKWRLKIGSRSNCSDYHDEWQLPSVVLMLQGPLYRLSTDEFTGAVITITCESTELQPRDRVLQLRSTVHAKLKTDSPGEHGRWGRCGLTEDIFQYVRTIITCNHMQVLTCLRLVTAPARWGNLTFSPFNFTSNLRMCYLILHNWWHLAYMWWNIFPEILWP